MDISSAEYKERFETVGDELMSLSASGRPVDITFHNRKPMLDVRVGPELDQRLSEGIVVEDLHAMLADLELSNGERINLMEIWTINEMPKDGLSEAELAAVDIAEGDEVIGQGGETLRQMVSRSYHCETLEEEEYYLRRFLAAIEH